MHNYLWPNSKIPNPARFRELVELGTRRRGKQLAVCLEAGLHPSTLHRMVNGDIRPKPEKLLKLAQAMRLTEQEQHDLFQAAGTVYPVVHNLDENSWEYSLAKLAIERAWPLPAYVHDLAGNFVFRTPIVDLVWGALGSNPNLFRLIFDSKRRHRPNLRM